jgi:hypothetical protein
VPALRDAYPELPETVTDRNADIWEPLIAIADLAGGEWPEAARRSAVAHVAAAMESTPSLGIRLLSDLRRLFEDVEVLSTADIIDGLLSMEDAPWADLKGKPLDARSLAYRLRPYEVRSANHRYGGLVVKGYRRSDFEDAWTRYLRSSPIESATSATSLHENGHTPLVEYGLTRGLTLVAEGDDE